MTRPPNEHEYDAESTDANAMAPPTDLNVKTAVPDELGGDGDNPVDEQPSADEVDLSGGAENATDSAGNTWDK